MVLFDGADEIVGLEKVGEIRAHYYKGLLG
jgi:hypothetical protein